MRRWIRNRVRQMVSVHESVGRSLAKALSYRVFMVVVSVSVAFVFTRNVGQALGIGLVTNVFKTFTYFGYERLWARTDWGLDGAGRDGDGLATDGSGEPTLSSLVGKVKRHPDSPKAGAVATFTGRVRTKDSDDDTDTAYLEFEKYDGVAEKTTREICDELRAREGVYDVAVHHREGRVDAGEDIVHVVALAGHRDEAFGAARDGIDRVKDEVPIFKKEVTEEGEFWSHEPEGGG